MSSLAPTAASAAITDRPRRDRPCAPIRLRRGVRRLGQRGAPQGTSIEGLWIVPADSGKAGEKSWRFIVHQAGSGIRAAICASMGHRRADRQLA